MHELSLCRSVFAIADSARDGRAVERVHLRVGQLRQVVPETLEHCWSLLAAETPLEGSRLEIEHVPVELRCAECPAVTSPHERLLLVCGGCGGTRVEVVAGEELIVTAIDVRAQGEREQVHG
jgi:hydrogenase nickel incorporation protein HypA/HybF